MATKRGLMIVLVLFMVAILIRMMTMTVPNKASMKDLPDFAIPLAAPAQPTRLSRLRGKVVILDFWATWCQPCQMSMPHLETIYRKYKDQGLVVIGISEDDLAMKDQLAQQAKKIGVTYPMAMAAEMNDIGTTFPHQSIPMLYLIDKQGALVDTEEGYSPDVMDALDHTIRDMLAK